MNIKLILIFLLCLMPGLKALAKEVPEQIYQHAWCSEHHGRAEVVLADNTRADCITATHAIEFDFGPKWAEAIGQALYYSKQTGKRAGVVLIIDPERGWKYWVRLNDTIKEFNLPVDTWAIRRSD